MKKSAQEALAEELFKYFNKKYGVDREAVDEAIRQFGLVKPTINTYFLVQAHDKKSKTVMRKKNQPQ